MGAKLSTAAVDAKRTAVILGASARARVGPRGRATPDASFYTKEAGERVAAESTAAGAAGNMPVHQDGWRQFGDVCQVDS